MTRKAAPRRDERAAAEDQTADAEDDPVRQDPPLGICILDLGSWSLEPGA